MLTFADGELVSNDLVERIATVADCFLDDAGHWHDHVVTMLCDTDPSVLFHTFRPLCAHLFTRFGAHDPDATAGDIAALVRPVVAGVWGMTPDERRWDSVDIAGSLIACDFDVDDSGWQRTETLRAGELLTALAQWIIAMSVTLAYVTRTGWDGGAAIRWFLRPSDAPDSDERVIVGGASV